MANHFTTFTKKKILITIFTSLFNKLSGDSFRYSKNLVVTFFQKPAATETVASGGGERPVIMI